MHTDTIPCPAPDDTLPPDTDRTLETIFIAPDSGEIEVIDLSAEHLEEDGITPT